MNSTIDYSVPPKYNYGYHFVKRAFDIVASFLGIIILSPLLLIILIIQVFVTHGHPVFRDPRVGKDGKLIKIYKFRSMYYDAETNIDKYLTPEQKAIWLEERKLDDDNRITPFGKFLRKTSIDELPQLFNILVGTMSLVGTRPMSEREIQKHFTEDQRRALFVARPGLTGYWQVNGRNNVDFKSGKRQQLELEYCYKRTLWMDLKILLKTFKVVLTSEGAK